MNFLIRIIICGIISSVLLTKMGISAGLMNDSISIITLLLLSYLPGYLVEEKEEVIVDPFDSKIALIRNAYSKYEKDNNLIINNDNHMDYVCVLDDLSWVILANHRDTYTADLIPNDIDVSNLTIMTKKDYDNLKISHHRDQQIDSILND